MGENSTSRNKSDSRPATRWLIAVFLLVVVALLAAVLFVTSGGGGGGGAQEAEATEEVGLTATPEPSQTTESPDSDYDGLDDDVETTISTDPFNPDTDGDGFTDGFEVYTQRSDPLDPNDPPQIAFAGETSTEGSSATISGDLTVQNLGLGTVDASAPSEMRVGETSTVRLEISPAFQPEDVPIVAVVTVTAFEIEDEAELLDFYGEMPIFSLMRARISAPNFDVDSATSEVQHLTRETPAIWLWNIIPREPGRHSISINVSVPTVRDGEVHEIDTASLQIIEFEINVMPLPMPAPTATPGFVQRTITGVRATLGTEIVVAIILAVMGAAASLVWRRLRGASGDKDEGTRIVVAGDVDGDVTVAGSDATEKDRDAQDREAGE